MAHSERKRQKKLMKKRQKDKARKKQRAGAGPFAVLSATKKILQARNFPIYECLIDPSWQERGLATILISRQQPDGNILFGFYLVDVYCLGLKNTFCNADFSISQYKAQVQSRVCPEVHAGGFGLTSDVSADCYVNYEDLNIIADYWLTSGCWALDDCEGADLEPDDDVDFVDFSTFGLQWAQCNDPEEAACTANW